MSRRNRWAYMANPNYNPPCDDCPECKEPSKIYHQGAKTVQREDGTYVSITRWACEHSHEWNVEEVRV